MSKVIGIDLGTTNSCEVYRKSNFSWRWATKALNGIIEYIYNAGCCQAKRATKKEGFFVAYCNNKPIFIGEAVRIEYINGCSSAFQGVEEGVSADKQLDMLLEAVKKADGKVLLHSHLGKILLV